MDTIKMTSLLELFKLIFWELHCSTKVDYSTTKKTSTACVGVCVWAGITFKNTFLSLTHTLKILTIFINHHCIWFFRKFTLNSIHSWNILIRTVTNLSAFVMQVIRWNAIIHVFCGENVGINIVLYSCKMPICNVIFKSVHLKPSVCWENKAGESENFLNNTKPRENKHHQTSKIESLP